MTETSRTNLAIAWNNVPDAPSYVGAIVAARETGANVIFLDMVKSADLAYDEAGLLCWGKTESGILSSEAAKLVKKNTWHNSNVEEVMEGIDCVILPGGCDVSPTLFKKEQPWHGIEGDLEVSAERDVSDYLLLSYCLDRDIPVYCICRGMQLLAIVSGGEIIQDMGTYYEELGIEYKDTHRDPEKKLFIPHDVAVLDRDSLLYKITKKDLLEGCPSWHHQMVGDISDTGLTVTATKETEGITVIEAVERKDKTFCIGVQFHPEMAVHDHVKGIKRADELMDYETAMSVFNALVEEGKGKMLPDW